MATGGASLDVGDIMQVRVWTQLNDQAAVNTFYYRITALTGLVDEGDFVVGFDSTVNAAYKVIIANSAEYIGVQGRIVNRTGLAIMQSTVANRGIGTGGPVAVARQTCGISSWTTAFAGPGHRGRTYWPFPAASEDIDPGTPNTAYVTALDDLCGDIKGLTHQDVGANSVDCALVLRIAADPGYNYILNFQSHKKWATQRRRGSYGRPNVAPIG